MTVEHCLDVLELMLDLGNEIELVLCAHMANVGSLLVQPLLLERVRAPVLGTVALGALDGEHARLVGPRLEELSELGRPNGPERLEVLVL